MRTSASRSEFAMPTRGGRSLGTQLLVYLVASAVFVAILALSIGRRQADRGIRGFLYSPLCRAALQNDLPAMTSLLKDGHDINLKSKNVAPLHVAVMRGHSEAVELLLRHKADVNLLGMKDQCPPISIASAGRDPAMVRTLLDHNADPDLRDRYGCTPLMYAAKSGATMCIRVLLRAGANTGARSSSAVGGRTAYEIAVKEGYGMAAKLLAEQGR